MPNFSLECFVRKTLFAVPSAEGPEKLLLRGRDVGNGIFSGDNGGETAVFELALVARIRFESGAGVAASPRLPLLMR